MSNIQRKIMPLDLLCLLRSFPCYSVPATEKIQFRQMTYDIVFNEILRRLLDKSKTSAHAFGNQFNCSIEVSDWLMLWLIMAESFEGTAGMYPIAR